VGQPKHIFLAAFLSAILAQTPWISITLSMQIFQANVEDLLLLQFLLWPHLQSLVFSNLFFESMSPTHDDSPLIFLRSVVMCPPHAVLAVASLAPWIVPHFPLFSQ